MSRLPPPGIYLQPGELLLWQGAPDTTVRFSKADRRALLHRLPLLLFAAPLIVMYCRFPLHRLLIVPFTGAPRPGREMLLYAGAVYLILAYYLLPALFAAVGLYAMAGHIAYKKSYARRARFYLTDRRVVLALSRGRRQLPFLIEWPLDKLCRVRVIPAWGDVGHLLIGDEMLPDHLIDTGLFHPEWEKRFFMHCGMRMAPGSKAERSSWMYKRYFRYLDDPARYMMLFRVPNAKETAAFILAAAERARGAAQTDGTPSEPPV